MRVGEARLVEYKQNRKLNIFGIFSNSRIRKSTFGPETTARRDEYNINNGYTENSAL